MSGPAVVCIKRKRTEQAPDALLLERPGKRLQSGIGGVQYVRQREGEGGSALVGGTEGGTALMGGVQGGNAQIDGGHAGRTSTVPPKERRTFHLKRPAVLESTTDLKTQKRKREGVATFIERSTRRPSLRAIPDFSTQEMTPGRPYATPEAPLKRPGRRAAVHINGSNSAAFPPNAHNAEVDHAVASSLHEFAQQVVATESSKPHITAIPKLPPQRSRELHRQSALSHKTTTSLDRDGDADMEDESDYVYDTYILAPSPSSGAVQANAAPDVFGNVGYLVITDEDQDVWETYLEDEPSEKDWNSDDEDENAEDWYGADYPDEELASDDEAGIDHGYRVQGAADDEEWDAETGRVDEEEYERRMEPWKKMALS